MGKVEKVIVLSVLFLIALILAVSLTVDDPLDKSRVVEAGSTPHNPTANPTAQPNGTTTANASDVPALAANAPATPVAGSPAAPGLLSMPIQTDGAGNTAGANVPAGGAATSPTGLPAGALLKRVEGLKDSILPDMKLYTWQENDTYRGIADHYYGDWTKFSVLRRSNEGRSEVQPGEQIFVPVFDSDPVAVSVPVTPAAPSGKKGTEHTTKKSPGKSVASAPKGTGNKTHVVKNGESLWKIARAELGDGNRWQEIYDLNKDVLASEKSVHTGQTLRIP